MALAVRGVAEADHVRPAGPVGGVQARLARHVGELAVGAARDPHVVHQVFAEDAARIAEAILRRIEQDARRLERLRAQHHGLGADLARLARDAIHVGDAARLVSRLVHQHLVDHGVRDVRAVAGLERVGDGGEGGVEIGMRDAAALAGAAVVAGRASVDRLGEVGQPAHRQGAAELRLDRAADFVLDAGERHRRLELAVGQLRVVLDHAGDADIVLDQLVVGDEVLVVERPVGAGAVEGITLQILLREAVAVAAPDVGAPAGDAHAALPRKRLALLRWCTARRCRCRTSFRCTRCRRSSPSARAACAG